MERWQGKVAIVTGASLGIGAECCRTFVKYGMKVIGIARNKRQLEEVKASIGDDAPGEFYPRKCNLYKEAELVSLFEYAEKEFGAVHVLVNMASMGTMGRLVDDHVFLMEATMEVNVIAPALLCKLAIENMRKYDVKGHIINIGGTASYYTSIFDTMHFYSLSKFVLRAIGDGLRMEFRANNIPIRITHIGPGHCKTGAMTRAGLSGHDMYSGAKYWGIGKYKMTLDDFPEEPALDIWGDEMYELDVLPALEKSDVIDYMVQALALPDTAEVMDIIMKPTDRKHSIYESDFYVKS